ncbi:MAG: hypothetical protein C5S45_08125 [Candidatus Methanocomedens sp.]|nr:MAG: hypothetical protein C5S45_08125 [ANME-2 cluster archaeon]
MTAPSGDFLIGKNYIFSNNRLRTTPSPAAHPVHQVRQLTAASRMDVRASAGRAAQGNGDSMGRVSEWIKGGLESLKKTADGRR